MSFGGPTVQHQLLQTVILFRLVRTCSSKEVEVMVIRVGEVIIVLDYAENKIRKKRNFIILAFCYPMFLFP